MINAFGLKRVLPLSTNKEEGFVSQIIKSGQKSYQNHLFFRNYKLMLATLVTLTEIEARSRLGDLVEIN